MDDSRSIRRLDDFSNFHFPMGLRNRDSFFSNFFDKDPFDDPFFTRPFGSLFPSAHDFCEPSHQRHPARFCDRRRQQQERPRGLVIEELSDDHEDAIGAQSRTHSEPIVEHPDDVALANGHNRDGSKGFSQSFSFSSVMYGGPQGTYYKSSTVRHAGSDGLYEEVHEERDSINGQETNRVLRGLGNKGHAVTHKKSAWGVEDFEETLHNVTEEEKTDFDETWRKQAKKYLPGHGKRNGIWLKNNHADREDGEEHVASPSSTKPAKQLTWRWPWAKKA